MRHTIRIATRAQQMLRVVSSVAVWLLTACAPEAAAGVSGALIEAPPPAQADDPLFSLTGGRWSGPCTYQPHDPAEAAYRFWMERTVPASSPLANSFGWQVVYDGPAGRETRDYIMRIDPSEPGHYVLDEQNGILLDHYLFEGGQLVSDFSIESPVSTLGSAQQMRLSSRDVCTPNECRHEIRTALATPARTSQAGAYRVASFRSRSIQTCRLTRRDAGLSSR